MSTQCGLESWESLARGKRFSIFWTIQEIAWLVEKLSGCTCTMTKITAHAPGPQMSALARIQVLQNRLSRMIMLRFIRLESCEKNKIMQSAET